MAESTTTNRWAANWSAFAGWLGWGRHAAVKVDNPPPPSNTLRRADAGETTGEQQAYYGGGTGIVTANLPGYADAPPGTYEVYRVMDADPVIALVRARIVGKILAGSLSVEARPGTPDAMVKTLEQAFQPVRADLMEAALLALSLGWQGFEVIWDRKTLDGAGPRQVPVRFKPLLQEQTTPLVDANGNLVGLRQPKPNGGGTVDLYGPKFWHYAYDPNRGGHVFGRSRHENVRVQAWWPWVQALAQGTAVDGRPGGRQFVVKGPPGQEDNARQIARDLQAGRSVYMENFLAALAADKVRGMTPDQIKSLAGVSAYAIEQYDLQNWGPASEAIAGKLAYYDALKVRGWHLPERAVLEGEHGTKAESETQSDNLEGDAEQVFGGIVAALNKGPVNDVLAMNFGEQARGAAWLKPGPLSDDHAAGDWKLIDAALADPDIRGQLLRQVDLDAIVTRRGIPKLEGVIEIEEPEPEPPPVTPGVNGNGTGRGMKEPAAN